MFEWTKPNKEEVELIEKYNKFYNELGYILTENILSKNTSFFFDWQCLDVKNENDLKLLNFLISKSTNSFINDSQLSYLFHNRIDSENFTESIDIYNDNKKQKQYKCKLKKNNVPIHIYTSLDFNDLYYSIYPCNDIYHYRNESKYFEKIVSKKGLNRNIFRDRLVLNRVKVEEGEISKKSKSLEKKEKPIQFKLSKEEEALNKLNDNDIYIVTTYHPYQLTQKFYFKLNEDSDVPTIEKFFEDVGIAGINYETVDKNYDDDKEHKFYSKVIELFTLLIIILTTNYKYEKLQLNSKNKKLYHPGKDFNEETNEITYFDLNTIYIIYIRKVVILLIPTGTENNIKITSYVFHDEKNIKVMKNSDLESTSVDINTVLNIQIGEIDEKGILIRTIKSEMKKPVKMESNNPSYIIFNIVSYFCKNIKFPSINQIDIFQSDSYYINLKDTIDIIFNDYMKHYMRHIFENDLIQ